METKFEEYVSNYELDFMNIIQPNYSDFKTIAFRENLNFILEYTPAKKNYLEIKNYTKERLTSLREIVSDKGKKEENSFYNKIVAILGLLTIFQVVPFILLLFNDPNIITIIRIGFLLIFFPLLAFIWYSTSYNNQRKVKEAEKLMLHKKLVRKRDSIYRVINNLKELSNRLNLSKETSELALGSLQRKLVQIEDGLKK